MVNRFLVLGLAFLFTSCLDYEPITSSKELPAFDQLHLNGVFDVFLIQGDSYSIRIEADKEVVPHIVFEVNDGILSVQNNSKLKWLSPRSNKVALFVTAVALKEIIPAETCSIQTVNTLKVEQFSIVMAPSPKLSEINLDLDCKTFLYWNNHQCGGKVTLRGRTEYLNLYVFALMTVDARELTTEFATIENNSKGDCEILVNQKLEYSIRGEGNILVHGNPEILLKEDISSGRLIRVD
jgi:hypothetical protein